MKIFELINKFSIVAENEVNFQNQSVVLYTSNKQSRNETKKNNFIYNSI